jgi:hypothetical protein
MQQDAGIGKKNQLNGEALDPGVPENLMIANGIKSNKQGKKKSGNETGEGSRKICFEQNPTYKRNQDPEEWRKRPDGSLIHDFKGYDEEPPWI